jgi:hypothetical protein
MAITKRFELARQYCSSVGTTGPLVLGAAVPGYLTYAQAGAVDGDIVTYSIRDGTSSEVGWGPYNGTAISITRNVIKSTNNNLPIDLSGNAEVFCGVHATDFGVGANQALLLDDGGKIPNSGSILANAQVRSTLAFKSSNYAVVAADRDAVILVSGTFTLSHAITAAAAGNGFRYTVRNTAMGTITIDPAGSETIDSLPTQMCLAKQSFEVVCDGANWFTVGRQQIVTIDIQDIITPVGTIGLTLPPDYLDFDLTVSHWSATGTSNMFFQFGGVSSGYYYQMIYSQGIALASVFQSNASTVPISAYGYDGLQRTRGRLFIFPGMPGHPPSWQSEFGSVQATDGSNYFTLTTGYNAGVGRMGSLGLASGGGNTISGRFVLTGRCK